MPRALTAAMQTALGNGEIKPAVLVELDTESGFVRVWSGVGDLTFQSNVYQGTGTLGGVSTIEETTKLQAVGAKMTLSGVPNALVATALSDMRQSRLCTMWFALFDVVTNMLVVDPTEIFVGFTDQVEISEDGETSVITVNVENKLVRFRTPILRYYTTEDQKAINQFDVGFEYVPSLQDKQVAWK